MRIDFHTHMFPDTISERAIGRLAAVSGLAPQTDGTLTGSLEKFDGWGVDRAVTLHIATAPGQEQNVNRFAASVTAEAGGRLLAFGSVHPDSPDALERLEGFAALGLRGVKLHPDYQGFDAGEKRLYPLYERMSELGLPCCFHAGFDPFSPDHIHATPAMFVQIKRDFPRLRLILAHMGGMNLWDDVEALLAGKDLYLDTAFVAGRIDPRQTARIISKHGAERILFGSDCPWQDSETAARFIESLPLSDDAKERILFRNAAELLNLEAL
ncbi:MAG: amidohydrolase [Provencibacterium sp.]|jgi:predicted TIM-barrel fold metal-dependent hydrolase|nr:amidohydrolase [Provencibacterium sp.]